MLAYNAPAYPAKEYGAQDYLLSTSPSMTAPINPPPYDGRGRQKQYVESVAQRKERIEFLKRREWARRVAEWIRETSAQQDVMTFGYAGRHASPVPDTGDVSRFTGSSSSLSLPLNEEQDDQPYVIYSSSPSSSLSSLSDDVPVPVLYSTPSFNNSSHAIPPPALSRSHHRRRSSASLRGTPRRLSLSSIYETPEED
ncbi:hypothetical protein BV22DRAFT_1108020 [Leucogyrophana mollusca]|uniref:Uncharacterized protein n=1 Tax=Leucogyrophana mollusca TaxID=85980 RepID=A0ACB8B2C3_9AGAM|nr:hypothetical protein BV22DRAFT_1108020 [Leucogyrophana mollusca]